MEIEIDTQTDITVSRDINMNIMYGCIGKGIRYRPAWA